MKIELIEYLRYKNYFVRRTKKGYSLVRRREATIFPDGDAQKFINGNMSFDDRQYFKIIEASNYTPKKELPAPIQKPRKSNLEPKDTVAAIAEDVERYTEDKLSSLRKRLETSLQYYDNAIIDVLHLLGDENCRLNAVQLCKVAQRIQELERGHTSTKKEIKRIDSIIGAVTDIKKKADEFDYSPYRPKVIHSIKELIE